jgi:hypothetical protein
MKDVFLSHAHQDKEYVVKPFAEELKKRKITYWLDEAEIRWGDKIGSRINEGLRESRYVVVFLTENFFGRNWTETELSAALSKENSLGKTVVLPIIVGNIEAILMSYPLIKDKSYLTWDRGIEVLPDQLETRLYVVSNQVNINIPVKDTRNTVSISPTMLMDFLNDLDGYVILNPQKACEKLKKCGLLADVIPLEGIVVNGYFIPDTSGDWGLPGTRGTHLARLIYRLITSQNATKIYFGRGRNFSRLLIQIIDAINEYKNRPLPLPSSPTNIRFWRKDINTYYIVWTPSQFADNYTIYTSTKPDIESMKIVDSSIEPNYDLILHENQIKSEQYVAIRSHNKAGDSDFSEIASTNTSGRSEEEFYNDPSNFSDKDRTMDGWEDLGW